MISDKIAYEDPLNSNMYLIVNEFSEVKRSLLEDHIKLLLVKVHKSLKFSALNFINNNGLLNFITILFDPKFNPVEFCGTPDISEMSIKAFKGNIADTISSFNKLDISVPFINQREYFETTDAPLGFIESEHPGHPKLKRSIPIDFGYVKLKRLNKSQTLLIKNQILFLYAQLSMRTYNGAYSRYTRNNLANFIELIYNPNFTLTRERNMSDKSDLEFEGFKRELLGYLRKLKVVA